MSTLTNSENPDEMWQETALHQCLYCMLGKKQSSGKELHNYIFYVLDISILTLMNLEWIVRPSCQS